MEAQFMKKLSNTEAELKKKGCLEKMRVRHLRVLVKILTVDQINNIEKNETSINKSVLKVNRKRFSFKILFNRIGLKKTNTKNVYIT